MWVESMEEQLDDAEPMDTKEKWRKHCIFRVPPRFKVGRRDVFTPHTVALGPFHHDDPALLPMEKHKLRAVQHVLQRAKKPLRELAAAVEDMAGELEDAYAGLIGGKNRETLLAMMVADGCFLLEVMRGKFEDYDPHDPVFGEHAMKHIEAFVQRDMLLIENQLPLSLLRRIVAFEEGKLPDERSINNIVAEFLCRGGSCVAHVGPPLGLHPLDLYRRSLLLRPTLPPADQDEQRTFRITGATMPTEQGSSRQRERYSSCCLPTRPAPRFRGASSEPKQAAGTPSPRSAKMLWESGVRFKRSRTRCYDDIRFDRSTRRLEMPIFNLDDSTEHKLSNLMAFEALRVGAGNAVTAFVLFMRDMVDSEHDVAALRKGKVLEHDLAGSDTAVVALFNRLTMDVSKFGDSQLCDVREEVDNYCNNHKWLVFVFKSWAKLRNSHLSSPWTFLALIFSLLLIGTDITQTVFAVMSYNHDIDKDRQERAKAPKVARWIGH